jgi:hypothetical protein
MENYKSLNVINGVNLYSLNVLCCSSQFAIKKSNLLLLQKYLSIYIYKQKKTKKNIQMDCHWKRKRHSYSNSSHYRKIIQLYATLDTCICRFSIAQYVTLNTSACRFRKVQYVTLDTCTCRFSKAQYATLDTSSCHFGKIQYVTLDTSTCNFGKTQLP